MCALKGMGMLTWSGRGGGGKGQVFKMSDVMADINQEIQSESAAGERELSHGGAEWKMT